MADEGKSAGRTARGCRPRDQEEENLREKGARLQAILDTTVAKDELEQRVKERTAQLLASNVRLKRINRDLQEFLFVASNDLQEPLRKIQILNDRIRTSSCESLDEKGLDHFEKVQYEARRMQDSIHALLGYSRIAAKAGPFVMVDLNRVLRDVLRDLEEFVEKTKARIEIGKLPAIEDDPGQMHRLFQNIVDNALKFQGAESPVIKIHGRLLKERVEEQAIDLHHDKFCRIDLEDNGIGFDEKYLDRLFLPFKRLHARNSPNEGTGMGLTICRKIVEVHGGTITARSTPGKGSTFIIILPVSQQNNDSGSPGAGQ